MLERDGETVPTYILTMMNTRWRQRVRSLRMFSTTLLSTWSYRMSFITVVPLNKHLYFVFSVFPLVFGDFAYQISILNYMVVCIPTWVTQQRPEMSQKDSGLDTSGEASSKRSSFSLLCHNIIIASHLFVSPQHCSSLGWSEHREVAPAALTCLSSQLSDVGRGDKVASLPQQRSAGMRKQGQLLGQGRMHMVAWGQTVGFHSKWAVGWVTGFGFVLGDQGKGLRKLSFVHNYMLLGSGRDSLIAYLSKPHLCGEL